MLTWGQLEERRPGLAHAGKGLLYQWEVGLAFLSTTRRDGGPRVLPMCPIIVGDLLVGLIVPGPKMYDLVRDGRYAMHSFPAEENEDAFYITGRATELHEHDFRRRVEGQFISERSMSEHPHGIHEQRLFRFDIEVCLHTTTTGHGDPFPQHTVYRCTDAGVMSSTTHSSSPTDYVRADSTLVAISDEDFERGMKLPDEAAERNPSRWSQPSTFWS